MKVEQKKEGKTERKIVIGMCVSKEVLAAIAPKWHKKGLFQSKWCNIVGGWCVKFYLKYSEAPSRHVENLFASWSNSTSADKDTVNLIDRFLAGLSGEYEQANEAINAKYLVDLAAEHFNQVAAHKLTQEVESAISRGKTEEAFNKINSFNKIELGKGAAIDLLTNQEALRMSFEQKEESIITYPGPLGEFFGTALESEAFVAFMAPDKTGKSMWLMDLAWMGMTQRRRVAFFECGDMSERQILRRYAVRASGRPRNPRTVKYPKFIYHDPDDKEATVEHEDREFDKPLSWKTAWKAFEKVKKNKVKSDDSYLRLSCHPNSSLNVHGMISILDGWERQGWVPQVVIVDYADILAPLYHGDEGREQINKTWKALRALSQSRHCLVATATQSSAKGYTTDTLSRKEFSDDKRKMAHCTAMIGINRTITEAQNGLCRLNWIVLRDDEFVSTKCCHVAGSLSLARPHILSTW